MVKQPTVGCEKCHFAGYLIGKQGLLARARVCQCVEECSLCAGTGSILSKNESGYNYVAMCKACGVLKRNVKLYNLSEIPAKYSEVLQVDAGSKPKTSYQQAALTYAKDFVKQYPEKRGFLLMGRAGIGKTHLAVGTIAELTLKYGVMCLFQDFYHLLGELRNAYSEGTPENEIILPLIETEVLAIDELGKGKSSEWELNILDQLISKRYNASKTTIITTNFVSKDHVPKGDGEAKDILEVKVGERISSRLYEMCEFIYLEGKDHRKMAVKKN